MNRIDPNLASPGATPPTPMSPGRPAMIENTPPSHTGQQPLSSYTLPLGHTAAPPDRRLPQSTLLGEFVTKILGRVSRWLSPVFVERSLAFARDIGQYAVLAGAGLTLLYAIYAAIKFNSFAVFLSGLGLIAALAVAQFAAMKFLGAAVQTIAQTPSRISSSAFLECTGLLILLFAAAVLLGGVISAIQLSTIIPLLPAVLLSAGLAYFGAVALHPELVNVTPGAGSAGEEAIGLLSFFSKAGLKLVPLFFCLLAVGGCLALVTSFFSAGQNVAGAVESVLAWIPLPVALPFGLGGAAVVLFACLVPIAGYFLFLLQYLALDIARAILCVPAKLDALR